MKGTLFAIAAISSVSYLLCWSTPVQQRESSSSSFRSLEHEPEQHESTLPSSATGGNSDPSHPLLLLANAAETEEETSQPRIGGVSTRFKKVREVNSRDSTSDNSESDASSYHPSPSSSSDYELDVISPPKGKKRKVQGKSHDYSKDSESDGEEDSSGSSSGESRKKRRRTRRSELGERKQAFFNEWNKQELGTHLPPEVLASKVAALRVKKLKFKTIGVLAANIVKAKKDSDYSLRYRNYMRWVSDNLQLTRPQVEKDPRYASLDPSAQEKVAFRKAIELSNLRSAQSTQLLETLALTPSRQARLDKTQEKIQEVVRVTQARLHERGLDIATVSLDRLEIEIRGLKVKGIRPSDFIRFLQRYLRDTLNVSEEELAAMSKQRALGKRKSYVSKKRRKRT